VLVPPSLCFITLVNSPQQEKSARLMLESLRAFGGALSRAPAWVFYPLRHELARLKQGLEDIHLFPLDLADPCEGYPFSDKVFACAQAEAMAGRLVNTLVWVNPSCLVVNPPLAFDLDMNQEAAFRPVHLRNVGSLATAPLDPFWRGIYHEVVLNVIPFIVQPLIGGQDLRPYFNTHCFSIASHRGTLCTWWKHFRSLALDPGFQAAGCPDEMHQLFLHQAVLSALVAKTIPRDRIRILPPEYSYPLHLHARVPLESRPASLDTLVCPVYEEHFNFPETLNNLGAGEALASWLADHASRPIPKEEQ
jgi:hypothetical protein